MFGLHSKLFSKDKIILSANRWDILAFLLVSTIIICLAWSAKQMAVPYHLGQQITISLDPKYLPNYALRTVSRMLIALFISLLFTFTIATWAAKNKHAERIIIPMIDILQSVPILGFLSITITGFMALFPGSMLGPECAAIFVIFTSQAWNIALGFYQSLITLPSDLREAADMLQLTTWQRFWRVEVPYAMPSLIWNMMMSMSASWFFVVASEAISVANQNINLPGMGSYIATAIAHADKKAVVYAIITMFVVILTYDQILFRPIVSWGEKFRAEQTDADEYSTPWLVRILQHTRLLRYISNFLAWCTDLFINNRLLNRPTQRVHTTNKTKGQKFLLISSYTVAILIMLFGLDALRRFIFINISWHEAMHVALLGLITGLRVLSLIIICSLIWVPIGVWVGLRPNIAKIVQPVAQFLAAFPANLLFPVMVIFIVKYKLNAEIWTTPLMILGTQWYILFNVIAGMNALPKDLYYAACNFGVTGFLWWRKLILPAIFPYFVTGALTAAGGAWNASIVAEVVTWGHTTIRSTGIGAYISEYTTAGDYPRIALGITVLCLYVVIINRTIWRPLYKIAERRYQSE